MKKQKMRLISAVLAACMMTSVLPVNALALGGTPENGVTAQENAGTVTTIPTTGMKITEGGNYEIQAGTTYTGKIEINVTDTTQPVNIAIKGNVIFRDPDPFIDVENAGIVNIKSKADYEVDCAMYGKHFIMINSPSAQVTIEKGKYTSKGLNIGMVSAGTLTVNDAEMESNVYCLTASGSGRVIINRGKYTHYNPNADRAVFWIFNGGHMTLNDVTAISAEPVILNRTGTVDVNGGNFNTTGTKSCFVNSTANLTINKGTTTVGTFASEGASCIDNNWGQVRINDGTITSDADCTIKNRGGLRMNGGTVEAPNGTAIDISGESGDVQLNGGTIRNSVTGVRVADAGDSEIALKAVTFENNTDDDISLGNDQQINIKKSFVGTAKIRVDDPAPGRQITTDNEDSPYQKKLSLISRNEGYVIGYKKVTDGAEFRYLAPANGKTVNAVNAKATANLGAGAQQLDTTDVVPEGKDVTVTADLQEGAEFLGWSVSRADDEALDWTPARDDPQTITFTMPDCNVTVEALYQGGNVGPVNPGGGSSDVVTGIAAVALTGAAVWGIYEAGTGIYRVLNMPGVPMPSNRAGLATLIWEKAGCPEPQTVKSFCDIDEADLHLRKAVSWMEEQGLMDDVKENEFRPYRYVTKLQTCLVWDKAKEESLIS